MTRRLSKLGILLALAIVASACAASQAFKEGDSAVRSGNLDEAVAAYRRAVQADPDNANYTIALQRTMVAASRAHLERAREFEEQGQLEAALGEYRLGIGVRPEQPERDSQGGRARADHPRSHRGRAPPAGYRSLAGAGTCCIPGTGPEPCVARPVACPVPERPGQGGAELHRRPDGHSSHVRPRRGGWAADFGSARRGDARAGAQSDHDDGAAVVQGHQRAIDLRLSGHDRQAPAVRRTGHPHVLHFERRSDRALTDPESAHPDRRDRRAADDCPQQDRQYDHRARDCPLHADSREDHRTERQAARRDHRGRVDPRGRSQSDEELRPEPVGLRDRGDLLASRGAGRRRRGRPPTRQPPGRAAARRHRRARSSRRRPSTSTRSREA